MQAVSNDDVEICDFINDSRSLYGISLATTEKIIHFHRNDKIDIEVLYEIVSEVKSVTDLYKHMVQSNAEIRSKVYCNLEYNLRNCNYETWMRRNRLQYDGLLHCVRIMIHKLLKQYEENTLGIAIKLMSFYNTLVLLELAVGVDIIYAHSSSSLIVQNKKKFTISRILKILAYNEAENCSKHLTEFFLRKFNDLEKIRGASDDEIEEDYLENEIQPESDSTSIVVFKTLTQYASPARSISPVFTNCKTVRLGLSVQHEWQEAITASLVMNEQRKLNIFFSSILAEPTDLLKENEIKFSKKSGKIKLRRPIREKIIQVYEHILWQNVGLISEHMLLWWHDDSLGKQNSLVSQKCNAWLKQYQDTENIHLLLQPILNSLIDCLCCYITSTSWDEFYRQALISAAFQHSRHELQDLGLGTKTGQLFSDLLYDIVFLANSCEYFDREVHDTDILPIAEQIPILHRLDHSIHMVRFWALSRAKYLSNSWNMDQFFRVTHVDVNASLYALGQLRLTHNIQLPPEKENPHFTVCFKMRVKLISEVHVNIEKLQDVPKQSLKILASVCKITSLAYLKICFPMGAYWQQKNENQPRIVSDYVGKYLDEILKPVLLASQNLTLPAQKSVSKLVLEILCEAWLDHIYKFRIKFSEWGAVQLLIDFGAITAWIQEKITISDDIRQFLKTSEILRRCEGVGRLLLRQPGESIIMNSNKNISQGKNIDNESTECEDSETLMPPEMYVPNQEKWLELRLNKQRSSMTACCRQ